MATENENLPGVKVTYEDGNLYSGRQNLQANTQSILFIGTAVDGPSGEPVSVRDLGIKAADKLFGGLIDRKTKRPHQASLLRGMYEAIRTGNEDIRLLRIGGRFAKTVLQAKDVARNMEQFLGAAKGNGAFSAEFTVPNSGIFVGVNKIEEIQSDNTAVNMTINTVVDSIEKPSGKVRVNFKADKLRPNRKVKVSYDYETRNYSLVPRLNAGVPDYSDPDYTLTKDASNNHRFYSARNNWSDKLESGHVPVVVITNNADGMVYTISSMTPSGDYIYRVGKGGVTDPLKDAWSAQDYRDGGISFTAAYDAEVTKGVYPALSGDIKVTVEYAWFAAFPEEGSSEATIPGSAQNYSLNYTPLASEFGVYYKLGATQVELAEGVDYGVSLSERTVTINAGVAPVGAQLYAVYKTSASTVADPKLEVYGKFPGSTYGSLTDILDKTTIRGVAIEVAADPEDPTGYEKVITVYKPDEKRLAYRDTALVYRTKKLEHIKTIRQFVNFVNTDPQNNVTFLAASNEHGSVPVQGLLVTGKTFLGQESPGVMFEDLSKPADDPARYPWLGDDGVFDVTNKEQMQRLYDSLGGKFEFANGEYKLIEQGVYGKLENYVVDEIVLLDVFANTVIDPVVPEKSFANQLAYHCATVTAKTWETIGTIAVAPALSSSLVDVQEYIDVLTKPGFLDGEENDEKRARYERAGIRTDYVNEHYVYVDATHEYVLNEEGDRIDIGRYANIVFGPEIGLSSDKLGNYVTSGAAVYSALISTLPPEVSTTNRVVEVIKGLRYKLSEAQHNQLSNGRFVTFADQINQSNIVKYVVKDGVTAALPSSDYSRLSTLRIVHAAVQLVRRKANPFIGLPNGLAQRNALSAEIQAGLDRLKELGVLQRFKFTIFSSVQDKVLGNAFITLELVPQFEVRRFNTSVVLRAA
jgi:hypothetical protein